MFLDLKLGIFWALVVGFLFGEPITILWIFSGVVFALLPDIDFWIELAIRGTVGGKTLGAHRTLLHNPLTYMPVALFVGTFFGPAWMTLFALGVFGHFIHDSMGMGFGIRWAWPFSLNFYKFFSDREGNIHYSPKHLLVSWTPGEVRKIIQEKGNDNWLTEDIGYAKDHAFSIGLKLVTFVAGIIFFSLLIERTF